MAELKYKTRGNSSPQGKPRVYFTCHPDDFELYFDIIADEILKRHNCAVYYYFPADTPSKGEREQHIEDVQLVVFPVTVNLLFRPNDVLETEFKYARENHISILPIMFDNNLINVFNQKCGNIQFLNKKDSDATSLSYDEKLNKFLDAVLISDETLKRIREAFDAYIFLSYRKKDRKYARELMKLIHKNELYRDIAIWYDEYLTPGEDFDDEILQALKKSELFMHLVTPNLLEVPNYIMEDEYPAALDNNKKILPAEVIATNRNELELKYKDIPNCFDGNDEKTVFEKLIGIVNGLNGKDSSAEHNFYVGLAYLSGIDVEVNYNIALKLITSAAEAGLPEAVSKLVNMYRMGDGVKRDYAAALKWQNELVGICRRRFADSGDAIAAEKLWYETIELIDAYKSLNNHEAGIAEGVRLLDNAQLISVVDKVKIANMYEQIGQLYIDCKEPVKAKENFEEALKITQMLYNEKPDSYETALANANNCIGCFYISQNQPKQAIEYLEYFKDVYEKIKNGGRECQDQIRK